MRAQWQVSLSCACGGTFLSHRRVHSARELEESRPLLTDTQSSTRWFTQALARLNHASPNNLDEPTAMHRSAERLRYFGDGHQLRFELDGWPEEVLVTGSCTLDPIEEHLAVARAVCAHTGLSPTAAIIVDAVDSKPTQSKPHSS